MRRTIVSLILSAIMIVALAHGQSSRTELRTLSIPGVGSWDFNIYLPPGYDLTTERYPVVYLFRGAVDEWLDRTEDASRNGRNVQLIADTLIALRKMGGVILVMPGFTAMTSAASEADYSFILNTLIPHIDQQYRTLPSRWHRGVDGFSLGGLHMVNLLWRDPERFASAGFYDGTTSLFNLSLMQNAGEKYFARLLPIQFLLHSAAVAPSNLNNNRQFLSLLNSYGISNSFEDLIFSSSSQHNWWYADEHMMRALPLHWAKAHSAPRNLPVQFLSPPAVVAGTLRLAWSLGPSADSLKTLVELSSDGGLSWRTLLFGTPANPSFDWNTTEVKDGTRYLLKIQVFGDTTYGIAMSPQRFTVDNPGNGAPDIAWISPRRGEVVSGLSTIRWTAEDPEGVPIQLSLSSSADNGATWHTIDNQVQNSGSYVINTQVLANSSTTVLRLTASDGAMTSEAVSDPFEVLNIRQTSSAVRHTAGNGNGRLIVNIADPAQLTGHTYRVTFNDSVRSRKTYDVRDLTASAYSVRNVEFSGTGSEGPLFDGIRLSVFDPPTVVCNTDSTRWTTGTSTLSWQVSVPTIYLSPDTIRGTPYPADYEFRISDHVVDTSDTFLGAAAVPLMFSVWNVTENRRVKVVVNELDADGKISRFDEVYILEHDLMRQKILTWLVFFSGDPSATLPVAGNVFELKTTKPLTSVDVFEFSTTVSDAGADLVLPHLIELFQNYPNPFNASTSLEFNLSSSQFVSLRIFDVLGREVAKPVHEVRSPGRHRIHWNSGSIPSGIYFYRLETAGTHLSRAMTLLK